MLKLPNDVMQRAEEAQRLLGEPLLVQALDALEARCVRDFMRSKDGEIEVRESAKRMHTTVVEFRALLTKLVTDGRLEEEAAFWADAEAKAANPSVPDVNTPNERRSHPEL